MMGSAFNKPGSDGYNFYPYEFTPLYFGTPAPFPRSAPPLGGGYVEPAGLNATPTDELQESTNAVQAGYSGVSEEETGD